MKYTWIIWCLVLIPICFGFYQVNELNYQKHRYIQSKIIEQPELLPNSEFAQLTSFGFKNVAADMYWLKTVQYIGGNVIAGSYKKYLYTILDLITDLSPNFEQAYVIGQLLLPTSDENYENFELDEIAIHREQAKQLGLKGVEKFCDMEKVQLIFDENDLDKIENDTLYKNPCKSFRIPYYLAYIYYFYLDDGISASNYYKIAVAQDDAPSWARILAAIMQGKWGDREKSLFMFLSLAKSLSSEEDVCNYMTQALEDTYIYLADQQLPLTWEMIAAIEADSKKILPVLSEENENNVLGDTQCSNYLAKAVREINLLYLDQADRAYVLANPDEKSAYTPEKLLETGFISFIPTDYQQYTEEWYGIIYSYQENIWSFDYEMGY